MPLDQPSFDRAQYLDVPPLDATPEPDLSPAKPTPKLFTQAILFGIVGAIAGAAIYAAFVDISHIQIGYLSILIAYLIAKSMTTGSRGEGGLYYQISSLILTYLSVAAANSAMIWWEVHKIRHLNIPFNAHNLLLLGKLGIESPFLDLRGSTTSGFLGLFILVIGMRAAWRMTSGIPGAVRHPFAL
jgi:hypothetical protein